VEAEHRVYPPCPNSSVGIFRENCQRGIFLFFKQPDLFKSLVVGVLTKPKKQGRLIEPMQSEFEMVGAGDPAESFRSAVEQGEWSRVEATLPELVSWAEALGLRDVCFKAQALLADLPKIRAEQGESATHPWNESGSAWVFEGLLRALDHAIWRPEPEVDSISDYGLRQSELERGVGVSRVEDFEYDLGSVPPRSADSFRF
jgi:hypothetical protein